MFHIRSTASVVSHTDLYFWKCRFARISKNADEGVVSALRREGVMKKAPKDVFSKVKRCVTHYTSRAVAVNYAYLRYAFKRSKKYIEHQKTPFSTALRYQIKGN